MLWQTTPAKQMCARLLISPTVCLCLPLTKCNSCWCFWLSVRITQFLLSAEPYSALIKLSTGQNQMHFCFCMQHVLDPHPPFHHRIGLVSCQISLVELLHCLGLDTQLSFAAVVICTPQWRGKVSSYQTQRECESSSLTVEMCGKSNCCKSPMHYHNLCPYLIKTTNLWQLLL